MADIFHFGQVFIHPVFDFFGNLFTVFIIACASLCGNGEALGDRHPEIGHFGEVRTLAAEQFLHFPAAFREKIKILCGHVFPPENLSILTIYQ
ncbi:hypothetical protein SDC9_117382 [bioreactor metagenome]|uniref:Uncharacterized protein n=1 Tax=bioreactor metagenome TaxID=1076179 RepID=A0A645BZ43_9ZZZZ